MKLGRIMGWGLLAILAGTAHAGNVRKDAEASMVLTGTVDVNPDGSLHGYTIDRSEKVPPEVAAIVDKNIRQWTFNLSAPVTEAVHTKMSLLLLAKPAGEGKFAVTVSGASFGDNNGHNGETVSYKSHDPAPAYPRAAIDARVSGTVFLLLRIGRDGLVQEGVAEQVNLDQYGTANEMRLYRKLLADAALDAGKKWTYNPPTRGKGIDDPYWQVRVPVHFNLLPFGERPKDDYGHWHGYIPGPRQTPSWISQTLLSEAPDAMAGDGLHAGNALLRLATPLGGS
ncbi:energy transducer TonB [Dyella jiangningensis]